MSESLFFLMKKQALAAGHSWRDSGLNTVQYKLDKRPPLIIPYLLPCCSVTPHIVSIGSDYRIFLAADPWNKLMKHKHNCKKGIASTVKHNTSQPSLSNYTAFIYVCKIFMWKESQLWRSL